ncbi:tropomyosin-2-like [Manduca sexta]|uniref:tropomyosin-2-like n=1 Tax=Manduca sexta TaxID=7130 RepID=UPI00188DE5FD|nr:tropomyosin-2-like [Manduca sexta]
MCQEQQIKSLSIQIDQLLEQDHDKVSLFHPDSKDIGLIDQNEAFKEQIKNLKDALFCNEEEKQNLQEEFQDKLKIINDLRMEIEDWKSTYEKVLQRNNYLENYTETFKDEAQRLMEENRNLTQDIEEKNTAIANLMNVINNKSQNINNLLEEIEHRDSDNNNLQKELQDLRAKCKSSTDILVREKMETMSSSATCKTRKSRVIEKNKRL